MYICGDSNPGTTLMSDHAVVFTAFPLGPDRTLRAHKVLVMQTQQRRGDYDLETLTAVWKTTNCEDAASGRGWPIRGACSPGVSARAYSPYTSVGSDEFAGWYVARMRASGLRNMTEVDLADGCGTARRRSPLNRWARW